MLFYFLFWNCERWILLALYFSIVLIRPPVSSHTPLFHARLLIWQWAQVNRFACLCVCGVLQLLTLKTCSCSLLETFRCSTPMCAQMICVYAYLQSLHAASSACFTMLWKSVSNQFSPPSQSGGVDYWQQVVFGKKRFKKNRRLLSCCSNNNLNAWGPPEALLLSTNTQCWLNLDTYQSALCKNSHVPELLGTSNHESVLVSIATCLVPPSLCGM